jgi:hypothetical protein
MSGRHRGHVDVYFFPYRNLLLEWGGWKTKHHSHFTLTKKTEYPWYRSLSGPQGRPSQVRKISPPPGFDPWAVQPIASLYTDYTLPEYFVVIILISIYWLRNELHSGRPRVRFPMESLGFFTDVFFQAALGPWVRHSLQQK